MSDVKPGDVIKPDPANPSTADHDIRLVCIVRENGDLFTLDMHNNINIDHLNHWVLATANDIFDEKEIEDARSGRLDHRFDHWGEK